MRRREPRTNISALRLLTITISARGRDDVRANALDITRRGIAVLSEEPVHAPEHLKEVTLSMQIGGKALCFPAILRSHTRIENRDRFGFELEDFAPFITAIEAIGEDTTVERRTAPRVAFEGDEKVVVELRNPETDAVYTARMIDLSIHGACVDVEDGNGEEDPVVVDDLVVAEFDLPGEEESFRVAASVRRRANSLLAMLFEAEQESLYDFVTRRLRANRAA